MDRPATRMPRIALARYASTIAVLAGAVLAAPAAAQDALVVAGKAYAQAGTTVALPIYVRDRAGTALDAGAPGTTVQQLALSLTVEPAVALAGPPTFQRAGVAASVALTPVEHAVTGPGGERTWLLAFFENGGALPLSTATPAPGDRVGTLSLPLAPGLPEGTRLELVLDPQRSALGNAAGDLLERPLEAGDGDLVLIAGSVIVGGLFLDSFESGDTSAWAAATP